MRVVLFNWRDRTHAGAGGAELYTHEALVALHLAGHECFWFTSASPGRPAEERFEHYTVIRQGTELTCRFHGARWLWKHRSAFDVVIDEVNTLPWFSPWICPRKTVLLIHQLAREVWWAEAPLPAAAAGYALEPAYLQIYKRSPIITISQSTAASLRGIGLTGPVRVVECPLHPPFEEPSRPDVGLVGFVGRLAPSKRIDHVISAVAAARRSDARIRLRIIGGGPESEVRRLTAVAERAGAADAIEFTGRVSDAERDEMLREVDVLALASLREGWGLVVSEAARWGIPAVAYRVPGLCDSIVDEKTGLLVDSIPAALAVAIARVVRDRPLRQALGEAASARLREFGLERFRGCICEAIASN